MKRWLAIAGALAALLAGCRAQTERVELSDRAVVLELPFVRQDELYECGLASISALCQYWGVAIPDPDRAELAAMAVEREGLSGAELRAALERLGLEVFLFEGALDHSPTGLYAHVDKGRPPIVMLARGRGEHHYCLFLGYDEPRGNVLLLDPVRGSVMLPAPAFERDWVQARRFTLLALPPNPGNRTSQHRKPPRRSLR